MGHISPPQAGGSGATFIAGKVGVGTTAPTHQRLSALRVQTNAPSGQASVVGANVLAKGTATVADRAHGFFAHMSDLNVVNKTITGAVNNGSGLIRISATAHGFATSDKIAVYAVGGTTEANGAWTITVIDANTFDLQGSTFTNAYTSGGTATNRPMLYAYFAVVAPSQDRGGLTGTAIFGDDLCCFAAYNAGTAKATDGAYIAHNAAFGAGVSEWVTGYNSDANTQLGAFRFGGRLTGAAASGCAIFEAGSAVIETDAYAMRVPNNARFAARNAAGNGDVVMFKVNASNQLEVTSTTKIVSGAGIINLILADNDTNSTNKIPRFGGSHYTNSEEPVALPGNMTNVSNVVNVGGGSGQMNAATDVFFYTAANTTTLTGTARMQIRNDGTVTISNALDHDGASVGFYGTAPVAKQTGVAVTAAGVHAALVNLGLIARVNHEAALALLADLYAQLRAALDEGERLRALISPVDDAPPAPMEEP